MDKKTGRNSGKILMGLDSERPRGGHHCDGKKWRQAMSIKQAIRDRVRVMNKYATNKLMIRIAGKSFGHFAILSHQGRKTGKMYRIPLIAEPVENGFIIALTYGRKVDWCANVLAKGGCSLIWKNKEYTLILPEFIDKEIGLSSFPGLLKPALRTAGIQDFLRLTIREPAL